MKNSVEFVFKEIEKNVAKYFKDLGYFNVQIGKKSKLPKQGFHTIVLADKLLYNIELDYTIRIILEFLKTSIIIQEITSLNFHKIIHITIAKSAYQDQIYTNIHFTCHYE